jgi:hypothetical protein
VEPTEEPALNEHVDPTILYSWREIDFPHIEFYLKENTDATATWLITDKDDH